MTDKAPLTIRLCGGPSSGKTTVAQVIRDELAEYGCSVEIVNLDNEALPTERRLSMRYSMLDRRPVKIIVEQTPREEAAA